MQEATEQLATNEEIAEAAITAVNQSERDAALLQLWNQTVRLIAAFAFRYVKNHPVKCAGAGVTADDLIDEGYIALIEAVDGFDKSYGTRFNTYLGYKLLRRFVRATDFAKGMKPGKPLPEHFSLESDAPGGVFPLIDMLTDPDSETSYNNIAERDYYTGLRKQLETAINKLSSDEAEIIRALYWENRTYSNIAAERESTVDLIEKAAKKARHKLSQSNEPYIAQRRRDIIERYAYDSSFAKWKQTQTSSTERAALKLYEADSKEISYERYK